MRDSAGAGGVPTVAAGSLGVAFVAAIRDPKDGQIESEFHDHGLAVYFEK
jgi:hypothetical protein